jgi:hypothetical protein
VERKRYRPKHALRGIGRHGEAPAERDDGYEDGNAANEVNGAPAD